MPSDSESTSTRTPPHPRTTGPDIRRTGADRNHATNAPVTGATVATRRHPEDAEATARRTAHPSHDLHHRSGAHRVPDIRKVATQAAHNPATRSRNTAPHLCHGRDHQRQSARIGNSTPIHAPPPARPQQPHRSHTLEARERGPSGRRHATTRSDHGPRHQAGLQWAKQPHPRGNPLQRRELPRPKAAQHQTAHDHPHAVA
jgi:hypothetical protein